MFSVGETLRRARQQRGLDLGTVAAQTKISARYLEAIESDDRTMLPSGFFYKSFVEQYARFLSLNTQEIDAEIDRVLSADQPLPLPGFESVVARNIPPMKSAHRFHTRRSYMPVVSLALVLAGCSALYVLWHGARSSSSLNGMIASVRAFAKPKLTVIASSKPAGNSKPVENSKTVSPAPSVVAKSAPPQMSTPPAVLPVELPWDPKPDEVDEKTIAAEAASSDYKVMLDLLAHESTWLSVSSDGKPVFSGTLHANETKSVSGKEFAKLRVGNAAGLEVRLNGKPVGPLGARGQVLIVLFTPDNFQIFSPPKESD
jgi:cytoskeleton protein RodZ